MASASLAARVALDLTRERARRGERDLPVLGVAAERLTGLAGVAELPGAAELVIAHERPVGVEVARSGWRHHAAGSRAQVARALAVRRVGLELDLRVGPSLRGRLSLGERAREPVRGARRRPVGVIRRS